MRNRKRFNVQRIALCGLLTAMMLVLGFLGATALLTPTAIFLYELLFLVPGLLITEWTGNI